MSWVVAVPTTDGGATRCRGGRRGSGVSSRFRATHCLAIGYEDLRCVIRRGTCLAFWHRAMLRAECIEADGQVVVRLHGRIGGQWVGELRGVCLSLLNQGFPRLQMDLENVTFIDREGRDLLDELWDSLDVTRTSLFAHELLRSIANDRVARGRHHEHTDTNSHEG